MVRKAAQLVALADGLSQDGLGRLAQDEAPRPVHWPDLTSEEAVEEWNELRLWVERLRVRFPNAIRLPDCWWRHNDLVEVLAGLRDFERVCFGETAPATAPVEWQRALRDMETRIEIWIKRFTCSVPGRGHDPLELREAKPPGWDEFVEADAQRRRESPTPTPSGEGGADTSDQ
ncbi:MAG TPA: hypothetical protein VE441_01530 [Mycobacterium sp.]|nr:hypothetical protein [Mycobacterium sp.]